MIDSLAVLNALLGSPIQVEQRSGSTAPRS
jgi:hypothetical protein